MYSSRRFRASENRFTPSRGVAQSGSALAWGARGRVFESLRPDHIQLHLQSPVRKVWALSFLQATRFWGWRPGLVVIATKAQQSIDLRFIVPIMRSSSGVCGSLNFL